MHACSDAWRCCDWKGRAARVLCELLLAATFSVLCWTLTSIEMYCWEAAKRSQVAITELLLFRKSTSVILRDALPASQRLCANGPFENCQVRMFKQRACFWSSRTDGSCSYLLLKTKQFCSSQNCLTFYIMFHLTLIFYPHHTGMRSQMLHTNGSFKICQERMFVKQRRTHSWRTYLLSTKIFMLKQKSSKLYMIYFNSVKKFLSNYLCTLHWHAFTNALHKRVIWNLPRTNVCEAASNTRLKHLLAIDKNIHAQAKIIKSLHGRF